MHNSPGGKLNLKKSKLEITPGRKRAVGKIDGRVLDNLTPAKKIFTHNDNSVRKILKGKLGTRVGLPNSSDQLSKDSEVDQSQRKTGAKQSRD